LAVPRGALAPGLRAAVIVACAVGVCWASCALGAWSGERGKRADRGQHGVELGVLRRQPDRAMWRAGTTKGDRADAIDGCSALGDLVGPVLQCQAGLPRVIRRGDGLLWAPVGALLDEL
jgi:hypothetical protein